MSEALHRLRQATHRREELRREWDQARNRDLLGLLLLTLPPLFGAERGGLFVLDPTNKKLWLEAGTGVAERRIVVDVDGSLVGEALRDGAVIARDGLESTPRASTSRWLPLPVSRCATPDRAGLRRGDRAGRRRRPGPQQDRRRAVERSGEDPAPRHRACDRARP